MLLKKNFDLENGINITMKNEDGSICTIYYDNDNLCFRCDNYKKDESFYILKNKELYSQMRYLFQQIKSYDKLCYVSRNKLMSKFEWISDDMLPGTQNRLIIIETIDGYSIRFVKNKNNNQKSCLVKFSLTKSNNQKIANAFDEMINNAFGSLLVNKTINKTKKLAMK